MSYSEISRLRSILSWNSVGGIAPCSTRLSSLMLGILTSKQRLYRFSICDRPRSPKRQPDRVRSCQVLASDEVCPHQVGRKDYAMVTSNAAERIRFPLDLPVEHASRNLFEMFSRL